MRCCGTTASSSSSGRFLRLGSLALVWCSFFSTVLLRAVLTVSKPSVVVDATSINTNVVETVDHPYVQVRLTLHHGDALARVPSCQHSFAQMEIKNLVRQH